MVAAIANRIERPRQVLRSMQGMGKTAAADTSLVKTEHEPSALHEHCAGGVGMNWLNKCHFGDCLETLRMMPDGMVQTCVTSPPYFGLRDYSGGAAEIGKEKTPAEFVAALAAVFREVKRVLRDDGTAWVNLGDTYREKCLQMIPARFAIAMIDDGWILRNEIIAKKNLTPQSVTDRCTHAHEQFFLFQRRPRATTLTLVRLKSLPFGMLMGLVRNHAKRGLMTITSRCPQAKRPASGQAKNAASLGVNMPTVRAKRRSALLWTCAISALSGALPQRPMPVPTSPPSRPP